MQSIQRQWNWRPGAPQVAILVLALAGLGIATSLLWKRDAGDSDSRVQTIASRIEFPSIQALSAGSQAVVVATLVKEHSESVREPSPVDVSRADTRVDVVRQFAVTRVIKGDVGGDLVVARWTLSSHSDVGGGRFADATYDTLNLSAGTEYVLFLRQLSDPAIGPFWGVSGEPGVAELKGKDLWFVTTLGFRDDVSRRGLALGRTGAPAAFDVNLDEVAVAAMAPAPTVPVGSSRSSPTRAAELAAFTSELGQLNSAQAIRDALVSHGLDREAASDRGFCMKLEVLIRDQGRVGHVDLRCTP